jgi:putative protein-disulfide isomerase
LEVFKTYLPKEAIVFANDMQRTIYFDGIPPTEKEHYHPYIQNWGLRADIFIHKMNDREIMSVVNIGFHISRMMNVSDFPTVTMKRNGKTSVLTEGYASLQPLNERLKQPIRQKVEL